MKTETEHSREAENRLQTFVQQGRWERCARHCRSMQRRYALCCDEKFVYGLDYAEVIELMELWLYWAALQDLYALPGICEGGAFAAAEKTLAAFIDEARLRPSGRGQPIPTALSGRNSAVHRNFTPLLRQGG